MMSDDSDEPGEIIMDGPFDPDAQATVTDFIDYTEYLPSDIVRSLTLIRGLDQTYMNATAAVHELTRTYGQLPTLPEDTRPSPVELRERISEQLGHALNARESAYAESCRLYDIVDRHFDRLGSIKSKLNALLSTLPGDNVESEQSTQAQRPKSSRKSSDAPPAPRITLRMDGPRRSLGADDTVPKGRHRSATRTSHLVPFNPDSPIASTEHSGDESSNAPPPTRGLGEAAPSGEKATVPKKLKQGKARQMIHQSEVRTNAAINATETSTSNALALLQPPPPDAPIGSEHYPWLRLSEWEMTTLRKKMKKNNVWQPSEIMIRRELAVRGRGWEGYKAAKALAEKNGTELIDCDNVTKNYIPGKLLRVTEANAGALSSEEAKISNRGMKLNEAKKLKRENLAREQAALAAAEAEMAAKRLSDIGSTFKSLFSIPADQSRYNSVQTGLLGKSFLANGLVTKDRETKKQTTTRKRKHGETAAPLETPQALDSTVAAAAAAPAKGSTSTKKSKPSRSPASSAATPVEETPAGGAATAAAIATKVPPVIAAPTAISKKASPATSPVESRRSAGPATRQPSAIAKPQPTPTPPVTRASSRPRSATVASLDSAGRERLRKKSATPAVIKLPVPEQATTTTASGRRSKRPAPGPVTAGQDGGAAVSVGRRKAKPAPKRKKDQSQKEALAQDVRIDEDGVLEEIDPNEPRYCLCGDVSFGTMICCEDNDCDREWFHLDCVGLSEVPSRTAKWYCPECRKKLGKGFTDGIVRTGGRR
ncbi:hypothetical protein AJ80_05756 [Polytolypa hystricis UAMH7299]|uniref:Chromatin modification-related protein n=1 Tax=Polytolypa hystricis (strain UAMH7299) TaxID=1447883 RepID=A0A2B7Y0L9_POLH7|nr:hypothetical protein AJ80_05756 [Polytolypa hystricis UAMH7299]